MPIPKTNTIVIKPIVNVIKGFSFIDDFMLTLEPLKNPITIASTNFPG